MTRGISPLAVAAVVTILLLAAGLRFFRVEYQSYWNDEGNSRVLASRDVPTLLRNTAVDIHPPGYYLALKVWRGLLGESELALRGFSALAGVTLVALLYRLGCEWFGVGAGLAAALLGAVNPFLIYYSQEARMYSLLATVSAGSFLLFAELWRLEADGQKAAGPNWPTLAGYSLVTALGLYTHYAFGFVVIAQNLTVWLGWGLSFLSRPGLSRLRAIGAWLAAQALTLLLYLPWLPTAYRQLTGWPAAREFHPFWDSLLDLARYLAFGRTAQTGEVILGLVAVAGLLLIGLGRDLARRLPGLKDNVPAHRGPAASTLQSLTSGAGPVWIWLLIPSALTLALGLLTEAFSKFLLVAVPPLCLLLGAGIGSGRLAVRRPAAGLGVLFFALRFLSLGAIGYCVYLSLNNLYFNPAYFRDDYRGIAQYLSRIARPGDAVITDAPNQVEAFAYYHDEAAGAAPLYPLPDSRPLDSARTSEQLAGIAAQLDRIFVLYWGDDQADPERFVESWLNANTFKAGDQWFGQVRLATYAAARPATEPAATSGARFGPREGARPIVLDGYTLRSAALSPGDILQLTLFWRTDLALTDRYKVFVHLYDLVDAPPVAQQDGEPGGGLVLTTIWEPGVQYADNHGILIPPDLPPGEYRLMIGLYNLADGARLSIVNGDTIAGDRLDLGAISIR